MTTYDALTEGVVLHEDAEYYSEVVELFRRALRKYRPVGGEDYLRISPP